MKKLIITISLIFLALSLNATSRASIENRKDVQSRDTKKLETDRVKDLSYIPAMSEEISRAVMLDNTSTSRDKWKTNIQKNKALSRSNIDSLTNSASRNIPNNFTKQDIVLKIDRNKELNFDKSISEEISRNIVLDSTNGSREILETNGNINLMKKVLSRSNIDFLKHSNERISLQIKDKDIIQNRNDLETSRYNYFSRENPILSSFNNPFNRDNLVRNKHQRYNDILRKPYSRNNLIGLNHKGKELLGYELLYLEQANELYEQLNIVLEDELIIYNEEILTIIKQIEALDTNFEIIKNRYTNPIPLRHSNNTHKAISTLSENDSKISVYLYSDNKFIAIPNAITEKTDRFASEKYAEYFKNNKKYRNDAEAEFYSNDDYTYKYIEMPSEVVTKTDRFTSNANFLNYFEKNKIYDTEKLTMKEVSDKIWQDNMTSEEYLLTSQSKIIPHTYYWYLKRDYDSSTNLQKLVKIKKIKNIFSD